MAKKNDVERLMMNDTPKQATPKRHYVEEVEINHDLYKLEVAKFKKDISWEEGHEQLIELEHCHMFHTYDSHGRRMERCNAVGGHTHKVNVHIDVEGNLIGECGPAIGEVESDKHTHKVVYQKSNILKPAKMNAEAMKAYAAYDSPIKFPSSVE